MEQNKIHSQSFLSQSNNRTRLFYILAFIPLIVIFYYNALSAVIPFYGFLLLLIKQQKIVALREANTVQKILGLIVVVGSFFMYYVVVLVYPQVVFYGGANYVVYLLGLFLIFFHFFALKEAFAPLFLIVAATSSSFISVWLKPFLTPFADDFAQIIVSILRMLGINTYIYNIGNTPVIDFSSLSGNIISSVFVYECMGVYSTLVFSIILVVVLFEDPSGFKMKLAYSIAGLFGTFALNIVRVIMIFLADYFYGAEVGGTIHYALGYILFSSWLVCFLYIYSKRATLHAKARSLWKKMR